MMEIETDALQLLLAEESQLYDGDLDPDACGVTCMCTRPCENSVCV
ncbi:hypothetical protein ACFYXF_11485 [Streptomyces sp. NPDC002680]